MPGRQGPRVAELGPANTLAEMFLSVKALFPLGNWGQQKLRMTPEGMEWKAGGQ